MFREFTNVSPVVEEETAIVTLNKPEKRNALSADTMTELMECLEACRQHRSIRAMILASSGNVFCAGHDLRELSGRDEHAYRDVFGLCTKLMLALQDMPVPIIAEVQGLATAAGCQLVAACDLAVASREASFATPGVRIGLFCTTPMVPLVRAIGRKRAMEMLLTGEPVDAATALAWGLVNRVVPLEDLRNTSLALARQIAAASPETIAIGKNAFYQQISVDERSAYECAKATMTRNAMTPDAQEGISAFLSKRPPVWQS
jgi:enoyl-CoA hydratase/carnithine racemase